MRKDEKRILKISISLFLLFEIIIFSLIIFVNYKKYHYINKGKVIAYVNGVKIHKNEIYSRIKFLSDKFSNKNLELKDLDKEIVKAILLEQYIDKEIVKIAKSKKIYNNNEYKLLAKEYYDRLVREKYLNDFVFNKINDEEIKERYNKLIKIADNKEERSISHILVETEEEAERIRNIIIRRNNFEKMAKERSLDIATAIKGGSIGYIVKENIKYPEFASVAFLLKIGELSKPIQTKDGWHIIRINDIRDIKVKSFEDSKEEILNNIKQEKFDNFINSLIDLKNIDEKINIIN